jgi:DNA invertase Pin-like site-specific DNA recombinase
MLGLFAEFETNLRRRRAIGGGAKARGVYKGRKPSIDAAEIRKLMGIGTRNQRDRQAASDRQGARLSGAEYLKAEGLALRASLVSGG